MKRVLITYAGYTQNGAIRTPTVDSQGFAPGESEAAEDECFSGERQPDHTEIKEGNLVLHFNFDSY
jgi:hypothetical protein